MKTLIRRWLGINKLTHEDRTDDAFKAISELRKRVQELEDETNLFSGSTGKQRGIKEHVWGMIEYLNLRPEETFEVITSVVDERTERHFKLVPRSAPQPEFKYTISTQQVHKAQAEERLP